jgi:citrate synthase
LRAQPIAGPWISIPTRTYSSGSEPDLKATLREIIPAKRELLKKVKTHGDKVIGEVKIENTIGGMRYASRPFKPRR